MKSSRSTAGLISLIFLASIHPAHTTTKGTVRKLFLNTVEKSGASIGALFGSTPGIICAVKLMDRFNKFDPEKRPLTCATAVVLGGGTGFTTGAAIGIACNTTAHHAWNTTKKIFHSAKNSISPTKQLFLRQRSIPIIAGTGICLLADTIYKENVKIPSSNNKK